MPSGEERYYLTTFNTGVFTLSLRLPPDLWCSQCVLQWTYTVSGPGCSDLLTSELCRPATTGAAARRRWRPAWAAGRRRPSVPAPTSR